MNSLVCVLTHGHAPRASRTVYGSGMHARRRGTNATPILDPSVALARRASARREAEVGACGAFRDAFGVSSTGNCSQEHIVLHRSRPAGATRDIPIPNTDTSLVILKRRRAHLSTGPRRITRPTSRVRQRLPRRPAGRHRHTT